VHLTHQLPSRQEPGGKTMTSEMRIYMGSHKEGDA